LISKESEGETKKKKTGGRRRRRRRPIVQVLGIAR
jgi:hypothetical protein